MYLEEYKRWLAADLEDADLNPELARIEGNDEEIKDRFAVSLKFGTAGLRGVLGAGTNRMNIYVVRQATQGLANWVKTQGGNQTVAISYDSRIKSDVFAKTAAGVLAANGIKVRIYDALMPVPALSFATRYYNCNAGIMVTASHNPAKYNGYKAYGPDGCQMTDDAAAIVYAEIQKTDILTGVKYMSFAQGVEEGLIRFVGDDCKNALYEAIESRQVRPGLCKTAGLKLVYSPLNGSGLVPVTREILLPAAIEDADALSALLTERSGHAVALRVPQRGQRRALLDIAHRNAREEVERVTDAVQRINGTLRLLQETAQLPVLPRRMESYDISHTGGADQVGGMVVFQDGKPLKSAYRRFRIESCAGADDYGAMHEVLTRRFRRYLDGDEKFAPLPDLLLIDGGQEHARVAEQVLAGCGLDVPVLGMVKDDRHRTRALITARGHELGIQQTPALFALIGTVQEEVHRFAIAYHHQKHTRSAKRSQLDGIPGVGEARKKRLLQHFGTVTAVKNATLEQLSAVVPEAAARAVYEKFHG